jgi:hypothetical protein
MIRTLTLSVSLGLLLGGSAFAAEEASDTSRALLLARRVARMENQKDLPSRAVWLSNRVVRNSRSLAFHQEPKAKSKKRPASVTN